MSTINVNCVDQVLSFTNMPVIASGDINADHIQFTFSDEWEGFNSKICVFYQQKGDYFYGLLDNNNEVIIPSSVMSKSGNVVFGVSAYKDGVTRTSNVLSYAIVEGAYTEVDPEEGHNLVELIQQKVEEMQEQYNSVVDSLAHVRIEGDNEFEYEEDIQEIFRNLISANASRIDALEKLKFVPWHYYDNNEPLASLNYYAVDYAIFSDKVVPDTETTLGSFTPKLSGKLRLSVSAVNTGTAFENCKYQTKIYKDGTVILNRESILPSRNNQGGFDIDFDVEKDSEYVVKCYATHFEHTGDITNAKCNLKGAIVPTGEDYMIIE